LGLIRCSFCGFLVDNNNLTASWKKAVNKGKAYLSWRKPDRTLLFSRRKEGDWQRLYLCKDCVEELWKGLALEKG